MKLFEELAENQNLKKLDISYNNLTSKTIEKLGIMQSEFSLEELNFSGNYLNYKLFVFYSFQYCISPCTLNTLILEEMNS